MNGWQLLLFPFAIIYDIVTRCRNWFYDLGLFTSSSFSGVQIISVGNLSVGGTGKTPMVEYLIRNGLEQNSQMAVLSRGYGRKTKGLRIASKGDSAQELGDESFGYFVQFGDSVKIVVAESRVLGMQAIREHFPEVKVVILDDAFQHRAVKPDLSILLTRFDRPFWRDCLLPSGRLREARSGFRRSDIVLITKCQEEKSGEVEKQLSYLDKLGIQNGASKVDYSELVLMNGQVTSKVIAMAGLADNSLFFDHISKNFSLIDSYSFPDHKSYLSSDVDSIIKQATAESAMIVTTFKDSVKLMPLDSMKEVSWGYIPISTVFLEGETEFLKKVIPFLNPSSDSVDQP